MDEVLVDQVRELTAAEDEALAAARAAAGRTPVPPPEVGALLRWATAGAATRAAVEVGSAAGVTGLWLVRGLAERGMLTSIDDDPHAHGSATAAYERAGIAAQVRAILGRPDEVLPRLSDGAYDLVVLQGTAYAAVAPLEHAARLLRPGGTLVALGLLAHGDHAEARARFLPALVDDPAFDAVVLPFGDGVALATRLADAEPDDEA